MTPIREAIRRTMRRRRTGAALIVAMISLLLVTMISTVLVRVVLAQRERLERDGWRQQADWLALSAWERAVARSAGDPAYTGETWLPRLAAAGAPLGRVEITIRNSAGAGHGAPRTVRITVNVPDDPVDRAHLDREWPISAAETSSEPAAPDVTEEDGGNPQTDAE